MPGLEELYLTTMDAIEALTPGDALFMVQGSTAADVEGAGGVRNINGFNLSTGRPLLLRGCFGLVGLGDEGTPWQPGDALWSAAAQRRSHPKK